MTLLIIAMAPPPGGSQGGGGFITFLPFVLIFVVFYLLILRPQAKRQKEHQKMLDAIQKGDRIVTSGGIHGVVQRVNEKEGTIVVKVSDDARLTFDRGAVTRIIGTDETVD
jgi:preprotein translocase subunit YajC